MQNKCLTCEKSVQQFFDKKKRFCSRTCFQRKQNQLRVLNKEVKNYSRITKNCLNCKSEFSIPGKHKNRKFCQLKCWYTYNNKKQDWKVGKNWNEIYGTEIANKMREALIKRQTIHGKTAELKRNRQEYLKIAKENYEWICNNCAKTKTNNNFDLVVHHKDGNNKNNIVTNLEVLCQNCHTQKHSKERWMKC